MDATLVRVPQPRCPFCHDEVEPHAGQTPCVACRAWHHGECWAERQGCSACGARERRVLVLTPAAARVAGAELGWTIALWWAVVTGLLLLETCILPAFATMFREVGVSLPPSTELVLGPARWVCSFTILTLLHGAVLARPSAWRGRLTGAAIGLCFLGVTLVGWALFQPLVCGLNRKL